MRDDLKLLKKVFGFIFFFNISKNAFKTQDSMDFTRLEKFLTKNFIYYILHIFVNAFVFGFYKPRTNAPAVFTKTQKLNQRLTSTVTEHSSETSRY